MPGLGNVDPHGYARLYALAQAGDWDAAKQEQERLMRLFELVGVGGAERMGRGSSALGAFKAALYLRGVIANPRTALPYIQLDEAEIDRVKGHAAVRGHGHLDLHPRRPWDGTGSTATTFLPPGSAPAQQTGSEAEGRACSRFSQHIVADTRWRSPQGKQYLLVAGSRHVTSLQVGSATVAVPDHTAALPAASAAAPAITGVLDIGGTVSPLAR